MKASILCTLALIALTAAPACTKEHDDETTSSGSGGGHEGGGGSAPDCQVEIVDEDIAADRHIDSNCVLAINGYVTVAEGVTLTIDPGVRVQMGAQARLQVYGRIVARGTADAPILITSASDAPVAGDWGAIELTMDVLSGNAFEYVTFEYGGADYVYSDMTGALQIFSAEHTTPGRVSVDHCTFQHNREAGIAMNNSLSAPDVDWWASMDNNTFVDNGDYDMALQPNTIGSIGSNNNLESPVFVYGGDYHDDAPWPSLEYTIDDYVQVDDAGAVLTLTDSTVHMRMSATLDVTIGKLFATNVTFDSASSAPTPGDWGNISAGFDGEIHMDGVTISDANAGDTGVVWFYGYASTSTIVGTTFSDNVGAANISAGVDYCAPFLDATPPNTFDLTPCL